MWPATHRSLHLAKMPVLRTALLRIALKLMLLLLLLLLLL